VPLHRPGGNAVFFPPEDWQDEASKPLVIGLVNNMPDTALRATERQFQALFAAAANACGQPVQLRLFSAPEVRRGEASLSYIAVAYESTDRLWDTRLDGLIVSGAEPRARFLQDEPYWPALAKLTDWAEDHTTSTIWSCLAAQAAVLRADGIVRRPFGWKLSGVFACTKAMEHPILAGLPQRWRGPQTRYNDLPEEELVASGYRIISRLPDAGADMFIREGRSLFVFMQGHPEYDPDALFREYRRDIGRFLNGERDSYPDPMHGYFDAPAQAALDALRKEALWTRDPALIERLPDALAGWVPPYDWREPVIQIFANWLLYLAEQRDKAAPAPVPCGEERMQGDVAANLYCESVGSSV
jgi:homoserine O-succinyltransferase